ncbi:Mitochondrial genome maintenance MGM101 [Geosmithia morbida]|uniref:Mitochondrial genome maintenance protein MGM101 n=1 Tax=Geosmithia morbida TaxID=1094350 RepID=A0A9P4YTE8_9HYPO|nr:Mitochondrial genome maintenance MGM101 [Geosmithia morbida]KAF4122781.1 Mitochondrial genome maintenance MGM101 [Geosmithia morbida]
MTDCYFEKKDWRACAAEQQQQQQQQQHIRFYSSDSTTTTTTTTTAAAVAAADAAPAATTTGAASANKPTYAKKPTYKYSKTVTPTPTRAAPAPAPAAAPFYRASNPDRSTEATDGENISWTTSFHGISTKPVTREQYATLIKPLSEKDIEVKPEGIIYLPEIKYRRRLNEAFGPMGWGLIPRGEPKVETNIVTREYALIVDGRFVSQALGENSYFSPEQLPSAIEGCKSNALMRCCKDLGIASELWDPEFIRKFKQTKMKEAWVEHATTKKKRIMWFKAGQVDPVYPWKLS